MKLAVIFWFAALSLANAAEHKTPTDFIVGKKLSIKSTVLKEDRPLQIFTPDDYESAKASYPSLPVLYLLDGSDHFFHAAGLIDFLAKVQQVPPMIVVAIGNTDRTRDYTFTHSNLNYIEKADKDFESSGGASNFLKFLQAELIPYVDNNYRTAPFRILFGFSLCGQFVIRVLLKSPEIFRAFIAADPSLWWDRQDVLKTSGAIGTPGQFLFITGGRERGSMRASHNSFVTQLKQRAVPGLVWTFRVYDEERHDTIPHPSLYDGLKFIFSGWDIIDRPISVKPATYSEAVEHYRNLSKKFGYDIPVPLACLNMIAYENRFFERWDEAIKFSQEAVRLYPDQSSAYEGLADIYERKGEKELAIHNYKAALKLDPKSEAAKRALAK